MSNISKIRSIFRSPALGAILRWSGCVHGSLAVICLIACVNALLSLAVTMVTRGMIDGATAADAQALWVNGALLAGNMIAERGLSVGNAYIRMQASARLQKSMQAMVTGSVLGK